METSVTCFLVWSDDYSEQMMIGFSLTPTFKLRLPIGNNKNSLINIIVYIRDKYDCTTEYSISVNVSKDSIEIENLFQNFKDSKTASTNNSFINGLLTGNQNEIGQILTSISQQLNQINNDNLNNLVSNDIPMARISVSTLGSQISQSKSVVVNESILEEYNKQLNIYANIREYLINFTTNLIIIGSNSIIFQSLSLVKLTEATNQLTQLTLRIASEKCYQLAVVLNKISDEISFEDVQRSSTLLTQCTSNIINGINGPLQQRINKLFDNTKEINLNMVNKISSQINETISLLSLSLNKYLNFGQNLTINRSEVFMLLEKTSINRRENKQIRNAEINFPSNFSSNLNENEIILIRTRLEPLASFGNYPSNTNFSRSLSFSILNQDGYEISIKTNNSIELIIPRDPNLILPEMILQNVTNHNQSFYYQFIDLKKLRTNENLTISIHFQIEPLNFSIAYLFIYQFDQPIQLNQLDGKDLFCPSNNETIYTYYIDNQQISIHQSIIFGLRELTSKEFEDVCSQNLTDHLSIRNKDSKLTSNYNLRIYSSGCYYLDQYNNWQSDGLLVGPKTNLYQTQCFTNHF